ncbi:MAG: T9SS C-terminal target domain-containing protein [Saprospirales bacterium]|nr:MAG: T9SS C-terminal target domain-containing protein [Saprospirales bacterium]
MKISIIYLSYFVLTLPFLVFTLPVSSQCTVNAGDDIVVCVGMFGDLTKNELEANVTGGTPPYNISWKAEHYSGISALDPLTATFFLNDTTILNPEVIEPYSLDGPVVFYVFVEDAEGNQCMDSIQVSFSNFGIDPMDTKVEIKEGEETTIGSSVGGGIEPLSYVWSPDYNISDIHSPAPTVWPDTTTKYHLEVTDAAGCVFDLEVIWEVIVDPASHVNKQNLDFNKIISYPNPTSGPLTLEIPEDFTKGTLEIIDIRSGPVLRQKLSHLQEQFTLDIGHLPAGVYHIELYPEESAERIFYGAQIVLSF